MARKILLADDSVTAQNMGRKILADAGYEVITVNNGSAALKKISEQKPDLIVLDVYMPGYSGLEVCQRLKEATETSRLPVLLTVGKLEPFKPEEAKRARADAFIVKPFEASELLSALSKLEDKIVPRAESSKPGRFARVTASLEEGKYDKTVAIEEDVGWKDRIAFPSKKKGKSAFEDRDEAAVYNPPESAQKSAEKRHARPEEPRVDLGALAPEGLPKDVTPEEIAALAAAAAQVKGKIAEPKIAEPKIAEAKTAEATPAEPKTEEPHQPQPVFEIPQEDALLEQKSEEKAVEKVEEKPEVFQDTLGEAVSAVAPSPSDVIAALAGLNPNAAASHDAILEAEPSANSNSPVEPAENEPVTMAVAARTESGAEAPRWKAVPVALDPEDAAISLEHEMQKAYAAYAAAETGYAASAAAVPESSSVEPAPATVASSPAEPASSEPTVSIPALPAPEAAQELTALANASTDAIRAAVQELEMVAESYLGEPSAPTIEPASASQPPAQLAPETPQPVQAIPEEAASSSAQQPQPEAVNLDAAKPAQSDSQAEELTHEASKPLEPIVAAASSSATFVNQIPTEHATEGQSSSHTEAAADGSPRAQDKESESTTAAAWASWRRIRESGDPREAFPHATPQDSAAMAVAAGAEKAPEEATSESDSESAEIANIVDSVLAGLRPKIVEEISRKMGKKK